ncbi:type-1 angiotensin II receptor-associated protein [Ischnura elegans]|uniref:type-1 angiotensin II receptor-associated protein n=1 Tax=Ischnura elegans TaxID=197161 RepID=UPI001ED8B312|nr:type-1 angiotensin II receptor-associated protein [Ischnura elegans]
MVDLSNVQNAPIKIIFIIHFILSTWGMQGVWAPNSYFFYNIVFIILLFWALLHKDSSEPIQMALLVNLVSILLDVILLSSFFPGSYFSRERFSVGMAILNLVFRPMTSFGLYRIWQDRDGIIGAGGPAFPGNLGDLFGGGAAGSQRSPYEDIDGSPNRGVAAGNTAGMFPDSKAAPSYHG